MCMCVLKKVLRGGSCVVGDAIGLFVYACIGLVPAVEHYKYMEVLKTLENSG